MFSSDCYLVEPLAPPAILHPGTLQKKLQVAFWQEQGVAKKARDNKAKVCVAHTSQACPTLRSPNTKKHDKNMEDRRTSTAR